MRSHSAVWDAIDALARRNGLSPSGLARLAGLDATAFNKSKRTSKDGRPRWPSTESVAKIVDATNERFAEFFAAAQQDGFEDTSRQGSTIPLLGLAQAGSGGFFDSSGFPVGQGWDEVNLPAASEAGTYALEVVGDSMLPLYRDGDTIIVSPADQVRRGDRVVVCTKAGEVMVKILHRQTARAIELHSLNPDHKPRMFEVSEIEWVARIVWASQ